MPEAPRPALTDAPAPPPAPRRLRAPLAIGIASVLLILGLGLLGPRFNLWSWGCEYELRSRPIAGIAFVALVFAALPWLLRWVRSPAAAWKKLLVLVPLGACLQWAVVLAEARGERPMAEKLLETGHAEFLRISLTPLPDGLVRRYEELIPAHGWVFPRSKPPGCLMAYRAGVALAESPVGAALRRVVYGPADAFDVLSRVRQRIAAVFFLLLPLLTFLTVVPLYLLARDLAGARAADVSVLLFLTAPMVLSVLMHLDGGLYPLLGTTALWLAHSGARRRSDWQTAAGGLVLSLGLFTSFSLLPLVPLGVLLVAAAAFAGDGAPRVARLRRAALSAGAFLGGLLAFHLLLVVAFHYRPLARFASARAFHAVYKSNVPLAPWLWGNLVQLALSLGLPLGLSAAAAVAWAARRGRWRTAAGALAPGLAVLVLITDLIGDAKGEVMRLWLFLVPFVAIVAAGRMVAWEEEGRRPVVAAALALQLAYLFVFKSLFDCR
jgi:hypothetical protein